MLSFANISLALLRHGNIIKRRKLFCRWGFVEGGFDGGGGGGCHSGICPGAGSVMSSGGS